MCRIDPVERVHVCMHVCVYVRIDISMDLYPCSNISPGASLVATQENESPYYSIAMFPQQTSQTRVFKTFPRHRVFGFLRDIFHEYHRNIIHLFKIDGLECISRRWFIIYQQKINNRNSMPAENTWYGATRAPNQLFWIFRQTFKPRVYVLTPRYFFRAKLTEFSMRRKNSFLVLRLQALFFFSL